MISILWLVDNFELFALEDVSITDLMGSLTHFITRSPVPLRHDILLESGIDLQKLDFHALPDM